MAFVGASGCGKSTISKLISGLYKPWSGEILFDGKPISQIDRCVFTGSLAVVDQDIILFEDTIANNIKMWDNSIEDFEMIMAARDAQLHEDIMRREGGYQYKLTEGGKDLSGGQRQRMEIARVLAQDPTIIAFGRGDERAGCENGIRRGALHQGPRHHLHRGGAPLIHHTRLRRDHRDGAGQCRGARDARGADEKRRRLYAPGVQRVGGDDTMGWFDEQIKRAQAIRRRRVFRGLCEYGVRRDGESGSRRRSPATAPLPRTRSTKY